MEDDVQAGTWGALLLREGYPKGLEHDMVGTNLGDCRPGYSVCSREIRGCMVVVPL